MAEFQEIRTLVPEVSLVATLVMALVGCFRTNTEAEKWLTFRCPDGQTVMARFQLPEDRFVNVLFVGRELRLPHVISGSGARYRTARQLFGTKAEACLWK
ncbi:MAG TPA: MliC family protein [Candidatus Binatia bacterium]